MTCIIQLNINGLYKRSVDKNRILHELNPHILCFQETNLKNTHLPNLKNYTGYIKNSGIENRASGGVATFMKNNIDIKEVIIQTHIEIGITLVELDKQLCICNIDEFTYKQVRGIEIKCIKYIYFVIYYLNILQIPRIKMFFFSDVPSYKNYVCAYIKRLRH